MNTLGWIIAALVIGFIAGIVACELVIIEEASKLVQ